LVLSTRHRCDQSHVDVAATLILTRDSKPQESPSVGT